MDQGRNALLLQWKVLALDQDFLKQILLENMLLPFLSMLSCFALKQLLGIPIVFGLHSCFGDRKYGFINFILSCFPLKSIEKKKTVLSSYVTENRGWWI